MAGTLSVIDQAVWPPRKLITATGLVNGFFTIYRVVGGARTALRGADDIIVWPATVHLVVDAEMPFGVPFTYELVEGSTTSDTDGPTTVSLPGGQVALSDAINGLSAEVAIGAIDALSASTRATVYVTDGINRVVGSPIGQPQTTVEYLTLTLTARDNLTALLADCTAGIYLQRGPAPVYDVDTYLAVLGSAERRFSQDGSDERRITAVQVAYVPSGWPTGLEATGYTYADLAAYYAGQTYADVAADYATYLALAQGDFG
jgi:hypothetical protein